MLASLAAVMVALLLAGVLARVDPAAAGKAMAALSAAAVALGFIALLLGSRSGLALPLNLPGRTLGLALDPVSAFFLLPVGIMGAAAGVCGTRHGPAMPVLLAAMVLTILAGDPVTLVLGYALIGAARWRLAGDTAQAAFAATGPLCLLAALSNTAPHAGFAMMRATPPEGWRAAAVLMLAILASAPAFGVARAAAQEARPATVLLDTGVAWTGAYVLARLLLDLCGPATPAWFGAPLLALGAAALILGGVAANRAATMDGVLAGIGVQSGGLVTLGLGTALYARGSDLPGLASMAVGGALLHAVTHATAIALAMLCADAAAATAGTGALDRLGGLARAMPVTASCLLAAAISLAGLPLTAGFASLWLLLQTVIAGSRIGSLPMQVGMALAGASIAMGAALGAAGVLRLAGLAFLGRPRTPRAAAAEDPPLVRRAALSGMAGLLGLAGLLPGLALALTAGARRILSAASVPVSGGWLAIASGTDLPGYQPLALAALAALAAGGLWLAVRRLPSPAAAAPWEGGFAPAPAWLPFGEPALQTDGAALEAPVLDALGGPATWARPVMPGLARTMAWFTRPHAPPRPRLAVAVLLALAVAALVGAAWLKGA